MRVLFTCTGEYGHFHPMVPLARALTEAGHEVMFGVPESFRPRAEAAGFPTRAVGFDRSTVLAEVQRRYPEGVDVAPEDLLAFQLARIGIDIMADPIITGVLAVLEDWPADILVHGPYDFGAPLAAAVAGIPNVTHGWGPLASLAVLETAAASAAPLWEQRGLEPVATGAVFRYLYLDVCPPSLQAADVAEVPVAHPLRPVPFDRAGDEGLPGWIESLSDAPTVYVTLGTFFNRLTKVFEMILAGLREEPLNVVVTVGPNVDPDVLGPQPSHVHVERYIPNSLLLARCDAVVNHGGANSTIGALDHGLPILVLPQGADQFRNAERAAACGAARWLPPSAATPGAVRDEVRALLGEPRWREGARRVQREIHTMPGHDQAVALVERLAGEHTPLFRPIEARVVAGS